MNVFDASVEILVSLVIGSVLGMEREYRRKAAGIRTIALICAGSTLFTILSQEIGASASTDRVASNILTGVGFIGAGVIFKGKYSVDGITTATTIWIAAALGMAIGLQYFALAFITLAATLLVLTGLKYVESRFEQFRQRRQYTIKCHKDIRHGDIEEMFTKNNLHFKSLVTMKKHDIFEYKYEITGRQEDLETLNEHFLQDQQVLEFETDTSY